MAPNQGPTAGQPVFTAITHPELRKFGRKSIHTFLRETERYLSRVEDANSSGANITAISAKSSIDPDLLLSLVEFGEFENGNTVASLTDDILLAWLRKKDEVLISSLSVEEIDAAVKSNVRMNTHEQDLELRVMSLFMDYRSFLRARKWDIITTNPKLATGHICELLNPEALKSKVQNDLELEQKALRKDWQNFYKHVIMKAVACEEFAPIHMAPKTDTKSFGTNPSVSRKKTGASTPVPLSARPANRMAASPTHTAGTTNGTPAPRNENQRQLPKCLNPRCNKRELIKDCAMSTDAEKAAFLAKYREEKKDAAAVKARVSALHTDSQSYELQTAVPDPDSGKFKAKLADTIDVVVNGDYGADHSALSQKHLQKCADAGVFVQILPLRDPVRAEMALKIEEDCEPKVFNARSKARISTTRFISEGTFRLRNVEYLVFDEDMDEILIGRPVLLATGFNLNTHLAAVRAQFHDQDFSHIGFFDPENGEELDPPTHPGRLARLLLSADNEKEETKSIDSVVEESEDPILYNNSVPLPSSRDPAVTSPMFYGDVPHDDPIPDDADLEFGNDNTTETLQHLEAMISNAVNSGLPYHLHEEFRNLLMEYGDIFRTKMELILLHLFLP